MAISLRALSQDWLGRSREYRPSAFWFWNSDMAPDAMRAAAAQMAAADIREVVFHPIHGLEIEYLCAEYFERLRYGLRLAKEFGFKVWIYDEFGWPSGNAGGRLLREHPEHRGWILEYRRHENGRITAEPIQPDMVLDNVVGAPWARGETGYLDTLSQGAVRCFIDLTYERVYRECGSLFAETVAGFFTDEPTTMMPQFRGDNPGPWSAVGLPWTPQLPQLFHERFGYDIVPYYNEIGCDHPGQVKRDYWDLVKDLYAQAYYGQIGSWCRTHGVKFTGHAGEDTLLMQSRFSGSLYECLSRMDEPGIDYLGVGSEPDHRFVEMVTVASVARHAGRERVYCEAFGISPRDLKLGEMLRRAQGLALYGCNDIALMGFHQDLDGLRKGSYWPPLFAQAPWWEFYPAFRDGMARSVGIVSLGERAARYAVLYPQDELEQTSVFRPPSGNDDPASRSIGEIGLAIYAAGETFEFIFPEVLGQARSDGGAIVMPRARYDALIVPAELSMLETTRRQVEGLIRQGGCVILAHTEEIVETISATPPSWSGQLGLSHDGKAGDIRVLRFVFVDGELFAFRNATDHDVFAGVSADGMLTEWDPATGVLTSRRHRADGSIPPYSTRYFSVTAQPLAAEAGEHAIRNASIEAGWRIEPLGGNMACLAEIRFRHEDRGWLRAQGLPLFAGAPCATDSGIPCDFAGETRIAMEAEFSCEAVPERLAIGFEEKHVGALRINGVALELSRSVPLDGWDRSCLQIDILSHVRPGRNLVEAALLYRPDETNLESQAFYWYRPMPSADIVLTGDFQTPNGALRPQSSRTASLDDLCAHGWAPLGGIMRYRAEVTVTPDEAAAICGVRADMIAEDGLEILLDGRSLGCRIQAPYHFALTDIAEGVHEIEMRLAGSGAPIFGTRAPWGVQAIDWMVHNNGSQTP